MSTSQLLKSCLSKRMLLMVILGFSSGLPLLAILDVLKAWLKSSEIDLTTIGLFSLVGLPYTLKFLWAPFIDRYVPPFLGRRRGWMLITQIALIFALIALGLCDPKQSMQVLAICALLVAFFSASQDIVLDAQRRDCLSENELGLGSALFVNGYRVGMLVSGPVALSLADSLPWSQVYLILAGCMIVGVFGTLWAEEPVTESPPPRSLRDAVVDPFLDFMTKKGAILILIFILLYKLGDSMASAMTIPYYLEIGFSKTQIGYIGKVFGITATIVGGLIGGLCILKIGIVNALFTFGILQAVGVLGFALLTFTGPNPYVLGAVVSFENLSIGMATSAYVAFMAKLCNKRFSATQYALLSSLTGVPRTILGSSTGALAQYLGWTNFFCVCTLIAVPGLLLIPVLKRLEAETSKSENELTA